MKTDNLRISTNVVDGTGYSKEYTLRCLNLKDNADYIICQKISEVNAVPPVSTYERNQILIGGAFFGVICVVFMIRAILYVKRL